ncbi:MAG: TIGR01777 family oxidoreductase [Coriobacteriia bacterium]|nr:TIGR01777 family oxidoreductase [Coriobacteriia bacterium]
MRIAIAGGTGFIGRELTRQLLAEERHDVVWLSRSPGRAAPPVREVHFDHTDPEGAWATEVAAADAIINLSGHPIASRWNPAVERALYESRVGVNRAIVGILREAVAAQPGRPRVLLCASGIGIYGDRGDDVLDESTRPGDDFLGRLAAEWEASASVAREFGVRVACVRTGLVLGEEGLIPRLALPMRFFVGGPVGLRRQWTGWIHLTDIAGVYRHALESHELHGPINAVAPGPVTMRDLSAALGRALQRPSWLPVPGFALSIVLGKVGRYMLFSQRPVPVALQASGYSYRFPDIDDAMTDAVARLRAAS